MKLYGLKNDYRTTKVLVAAKYASQSIELDEDISKIPELCDPARAPLLETTDKQHIFQSNAILRYIAGLNKTSSLYGQKDFDKSQVDQWLEFSWNDVEIPGSVLIGGIEQSSKDILAKASADFEKAISSVEAQLRGQTFLVGQRLSAADIAVVCAVLDLARGDYGKKLKARFPNTTRWFLTCVNQPQFVAVLGPVALGDSAGKSKEKKSKAAKKTGGAKAEQTPKTPSSEAPAKQVKSAEAVPRPPVFPAHLANTQSNIIQDSKPPSSLYQRHRTRVRELLADGEAAVGKTVTIKGWCKTLREGGKGSFAFIELNDGSALGNVQVVASKDTTKGFDAVLEVGGAGASFAFTGEVVKSPAAGQTIEVKATEAVVLGGVDKANYPLAKKFHSHEHLRKYAHLRPRSNFHSAAMRVRNAMAYATHKFFQERGFYYIHTPLITAADCEGAGEMFGVTTVLPKDSKGKIPTTKTGEVDYQQDFFSKPAYLTVSGQLNVETHSCALGDCYTFGPTFRAENSHTTRHLAEFWMIEPEISFADLNDDIDLAEDYVKYLVQWALDNCLEDLQFFADRVEKGLLERLRNVLEQPFERITYTKAIEILTDPAVIKAANFENVPAWGDDLGSEHEKYITEKIYKKPVVVMNYPKDIKAFYMRLNDDGQTVAAADVLVPGIGELIGGSQREEREDVLAKRIVEATGLAPETFWWYMDLRKYGSVPHAGFGLGFERLVLFVTGIENIRDVIPFPRWPGNANF